MSKMFWFLGLCLSTVGVTGALQAGNGPSRQAENSDSSSSEEDVPDEPVDSSEGAASAASADDSAASAPANLSVRERARLMGQAPEPSERKPIRSAGKLSKEDVRTLSAGFVRGPFAGHAQIEQRNALKRELQAKQTAFVAEDAVRQAEMASIQGGWGVASAWDNVFGGKKVAYQQWRAEELRKIQVLEQQLENIEAEIASRGIKG